MGGAKPAQPPAQVSLPPPDQEGPGPGAPVGPGLGTLLQGNRAGEPLSAPRESHLAGPKSASRSRFSLVVTLLAADMLLIVLAAWIVLRGPGRPGAGEVMLVVAALGLGAWLSCCAFLLRR